MRNDTEGHRKSERGNTKMFAKHLSRLILVPIDRDFNVILRKPFYIFELSRETLYGINENNRFTKLCQRDFFNNFPGEEISPLRFLFLKHTSLFSWNLNFTIFRSLYIHY